MIAYGTCWLCGEQVPVTFDGRRARAHGAPRGNYIKGGYETWTDRRGTVHRKYRDGRACPGVGLVVDEARKVRGADMEETR